MFICTLWSYLFRSNFVSQALVGQRIYFGPIFDEVNKYIASFKSIVLDEIENKTIQSSEQSSCQ